MVAVGAELHRNVANPDSQQDSNIGTPLNEPNGLLAPCRLPIV
jgi:hypothetical protein